MEFYLLGKSFLGELHFHIFLKLLLRSGWALFGDHRFLGVLDYTRVVLPKLSQFLLKLEFLLLEILNLFQLHLLWELFVFLRQDLGQLLVPEFGVHLGEQESLLLEEVEVTSHRLLRQAGMFLALFVCFCRNF